MPKNRRDLNFLFAIWSMEGEDRKYYFSKLTAMSANRSIKNKFLIISFFLFLAILAVSSVAFVLAMRSLTHAGKGSELEHILELERIKLESLVNNEISLVLKLSNSPVIQKYFTNPDDVKLEMEAFDEIDDHRRALVGKTLFWVKDSDKKFYFDNVYTYTLDPEAPENYWYKMTLYETQTYNFNINYNPDLKNINLWINAPVFDGKRRIDRAPKPVGVLGAGVDLTIFMNSVYKNYSGTAALYFFNGAGEITGAVNSTLAANKTYIDEFLGNIGVELKTRSKNIYTNQTHTFTVEDKLVALGMVPALNWYIAVIQPFGIKDYLSMNAALAFLAVMLIIAFIFVIFDAAIYRLLTKV